MWFENVGAIFMELHSLLQRCTTYAAVLCMRPSIMKFAAVD